MSLVALVRTSFRLNSKKIKPVLNNAIRREGHSANHSGIYRMQAPGAYYGPQVRIMKFVQVVAWANMFYFFWYDPDTLLGHPTFQMPEPGLWTDEELGIPPDDYDEQV